MLGFGCRDGPTNKVYMFVENVSSWHGYLIFGVRKFEQGTMFFGKSPYRSVGRTVVDLLSCWAAKCWHRIKS